MKLEPVDHSNRLWRITDVVSTDLLQDIQTYDWNNAPAEVTFAIPNCQRFTMSVELIPLLQKLDTQLRQAVSKISQTLGLHFSFFYTDYWLDRPGWTVPMHTDSFIACSLQLYWVGDSGTGTTFYNSNDVYDVKYQFDFTPNTGYLMLNMVEHDAQPLQWHAMLTPITSPRLSSYTRLGPYHR